MLIEANIFAQTSFELTGYWGFDNESVSLLNSLESNPANFSLLKDWGLTLSYGGEFNSELNSNLYLLSIAKRLRDHSFSLRYTPGYQKDFLFSKGESVVLGDSTTQTLNSKFSYHEIFGFGYSYNFLDNFSGGFSLRYLTQDFDVESVSPVFMADTIYIVRETENEQNNFWKADVGINYFPSPEILLSVSSVNMLNFGEKNLSAENEPYSLRKEKAAQFGLSYTPLNSLQFNVMYETNNSGQSSINTFFKLGGGSIGAGITAFHDRFQTPFIAGIIPALGYSSDLFGITISGVKYFSNRNTRQSFAVFEEDGINNILNNRYSFDKAVLTITFTLNTIRIKSVELIDVEVINDIYPTLNDVYLDTPFATGKVINLTDKPVSVKPLSRIEGINSDDIQSPLVEISAGDTAEVNFYTLIPDLLIKNKAEISYADFIVSTSGNEPDDELQKAILVNGSNSWDGNVVNLKYFIKKDPDFSINYAKNILSNYKAELDTIPQILSKFYETGVIFNKMVKGLVYTSDPRASGEYVQFPNETIKLKGGDCDDLSVLFSALLESVGIETALVDYKKAVNGYRHVNVLVNTEIEPEEARLLTENDTKYFVRKNEKGIIEIWIPVETTSLTDFNSAWNIGVQKFNKEAIYDLGLAKGTVNIIDIY
jgi:hypothetical protein